MLFKHARRCPIFFLIEHTRKVHASHFHEKSILVDTWESELTLKACETIKSTRRKDCSFEVILVGMYDFRSTPLFSKIR